MIINKFLNDETAIIGYYYNVGRYSQGCVVVALKLGSPNFVHSGKK